MAQPLTIPRYVRLVCRDALPKDVIGGWLSVVRQAAPSGTVATVQTVSSDGSPRSVSLVHREADERHSYLVPLTRDLTEPETARIVDAFAATQPDLDFDVETNETHLVPRAREAIKLDHARHLALCTALAKRKHEDWVRERTDAGWRNGPVHSQREKTNPLLVPWESLPDRYRRVDLDGPQAVVALLNAQGYAVVERAELERLIGEVTGRGRALPPA